MCVCVCVVCVCVCVCVCVVSVHECKLGFVRMMLWGRGGGGGLVCV